MFGIMNINTGRVWPSRGLWYKDTINQYVYRIDSSNVVAVPVDYVNSRIIKLDDNEEGYII